MMDLDRLRRPELAKPALASALVLLLAAEWLLPGSNAPPQSSAPAIPAATLQTTSDTHIAQWASTVLARPLLSPTRRPPPASNADDDASAAQTYTLPRLTAIIIIGGKRCAVFDTTGEKPQLVTEGGQLGPYRLKSIGPGTVQLQGPNGPSTLRPQFSTPIQGTPPPPPAPPPRQSVTT